MKNTLLLLSALALGGCTSLQSISNMDPVYEKTTRGAFDDYPYCVVDKLENHRSWFIHGLRYDIRVNPRRQSTTIQSATKTDQNFGVFIMEVNQVTPDKIHVALKGKSAKQLEIKQAIIAANSCLKTASRGPVDLSELE